MEDDQIRGIEYQKDIQVDGIEYRVHLLSPTRAIKIAVKLTKLIGEPMANMAKGKDPQELLPAAVRALTERLDESEVEDLCKQMIATIKHGNKPVSMDIHFQGRLGHMVKVVAAVMKIQLGDFMGGLGQMLSEAMSGATE